MVAGSSKEKSTKRVPGKPFKAGQSGNPVGRPKRTPDELELIKMCRVVAPDALTTIERLMKEADKDSVRLSAAQYIIDRGYGKAVSNINMVAEVDVVSLSPAERKARIAELFAKAAMT